MVDSESIAALEKKFDEFVYASPTQRKEMLKTLEYLANHIYQQSMHNYIGGKISSFLQECRNIARLRQPKSYNESTSISRATNDLYTIRSWLSTFD